MDEECLYLTDGRQPETSALTATQSLKVHGGAVRWHDKDRDDVYRRAVEIPPKRFAIVYTGKMTEGSEIVL